MCGLKNILPGFYHIAPTPIVSSRNNLEFFMLFGLPHHPLLNRNTDSLERYGTLLYKALKIRKLYFPFVCSCKYLFDLLPDSNTWEDIL